MQSHIHIDEDLTQWTQHAATFIVEQLQQRVHEQGHATIALAGGNTPLLVYKQMASKPLTEAIPWKHLKFYWGDERCVPIDDDASNYRAACEAFNVHDPTAGIHQATLFRMPTDESIQGAIQYYERVMPKQFDLILLGMGEDGHIASLFPGLPALHETQSRVVYVEGPKPPPQRCTITPCVIKNAHMTIMLVTGKGKADMVAAALYGAENIEQVPAQLARHAVWFLDRDAASRIE